MLAIIDGDVLAYQACRNRWSRRPDQMFVQLDAEGNRIDPEFTREEDAKYLMASWENFKKDLNNLLERLYCTEYLMTVKGDDNYRLVLYPEYKMNRHADPSKQNKFVPAIRELAVMEEFAIPAHGREADDLMRIWAEEARRADKEYIICSIDKDLRCIPGKHWIMHYEPEKQRLIDISAEEAIRHYYEQLLKGDPTDNIPGVPRVGEVKAAKLLSNCEDEYEMQEVVVSEYLAAYGDDWFHYFLINAKLIHLQTHHDDYFDCSSWPIIQELIMS